MKKSILFIDPAGWQGAANGWIASPNNGIAYLSAACQRAGWDVSIVDMNNVKYSEIDVLTEIQNINPQQIGISCKTATYLSAEKLLTTIKKKFPDIPVLLGGPHITLNAENLITTTKADLLFEGDGETDLPPVMNFLLNKGDLWPQLKYGVLQKKGSCFLYHRISLQPVPEDIYPDYTQFPEIVRESLREKYPLFSSRGCPYHCIYCTVPLVSGSKWRSRSVQSIIAELKNAKDCLCVRKFEVLDDSWNIDIKRCKEMLRCMIEEKINMQCCFPNGIRADLVDDELAELMYQNGCTSVSVGFENTDKEVFENIHKGTTIEKILHGISILKKHKITVSAFFIVGLPLDSLKKEMENIKFIKSLKIRAFFNLLVPYPHTQAEQYVNRHGHWYASPEHSLHFSNNIKESVVIFDYPYFSRSEIKKAFIIAVIASRQYEHLSSKEQFTIPYYWESIRLILQYAPRYLPEFLLIKIRNIFIQLYRKIGVKSK